MVLRRFHNRCNAGGISFCPCGNSTAAASVMIALDIGLIDFVPPAVFVDTSLEKPLLNRL
jgi:hypothetical protein